MRAMRSLIQNRLGLAALAVIGAVIAGLAANGPAPAWADSSNVVVNPVYAGPSAPTAGSVIGGPMGGALQPSPTAPPPMVGMPLQLPPSGMPRSRLTLPPGMTAPPGTAVRPAPSPPATTRRSVVSAVTQPTDEAPARIIPPEPEPEPEQHPASAPEPTPDPVSEGTTDTASVSVAEPATAPRPPPDIAASDPSPSASAATPAPMPEPTQDVAPPAEPSPRPESRAPGPNAPPSVTMRKPEAPAPSPAARPAGTTRLAAGTTRLTTDSRGRLAPAPPPLIVPGTALSRQISAPPPAETKAEPPGGGSPASSPSASPSPDPSATAHLPETLSPSDPDSTEPETPDPGTQTAARPAALVPAGGTVSILFPNDSTSLPGDASGTLDRVAAVLAGNPAARATVRAYADGGGDANQARRTSLSRALSVRAYLIDGGVPSSRIDVRALGNQYGDGRKDRVDVVTSDQ